MRGHREKRSPSVLIAADEDALTRLCCNYIDNVKAYTQREKVKNKYTGQTEETAVERVRLMPDRG